MDKFLNKVLEKYISLKTIFIHYLKKNETEKVMYFRIFFLFLWIDMVSIFVLSKVDLVHILNPLKFLSMSPKDTRPEITLFFPGSIEELHEKTGSMEKTRLVELRQKTEIVDDYSLMDKEFRIVKSARSILQQLAMAPDNIRGVRAIKDDMLVKNVWFYNGRLIVHLDKSRLREYDDNQRSLTVSCIRKSLQANLGAFTEIEIVTQ
ncbi:MAG: hypothetical protein OEV66_05250 [Spirochaetia bacterium]|nr:hypothetical protein [Spirochaetia bacterium]